MQRYKKDIIQTNKMTKIDKIQSIIRLWHPFRYGRSVIANLFGDKNEVFPDASGGHFQPSLIKNSMQSLFASLRFF